MKKSLRKLSVTTETIRHLTAVDLDEVRGGGIFTTITTLVTVCPIKDPGPASSPYGCATDLCPIKK